MIYLENTTDTQRIHIPKVVDSPLSGLQLSLRSTTTNESVVMTATEVRESDLYYSMTISLDDIETGEYEYQLTTGDGVLLSNGIAMVGISTEAFIEYENIIEYGD